MTKAPTDPPKFSCGCTARSTPYIMKVDGKFTACPECLRIGRILKCEYCKDGLVVTSHFNLFGIVIYSRQAVCSKCGGLDWYVNMDYLEPLKPESPKSPPPPPKKPDPLARGIGNDVSTRYGVLLDITRYLQVGDRIELNLDQKSYEVKRTH